jgi:hypothetical protein
LALRGFGRECSRRRIVIAAALTESWGVGQAPADGSFGPGGCLPPNPIHFPSGFWLAGYGPLLLLPDPPSSTRSVSEERPRFKVRLTSLSASWFFSEGYIDVPYHVVGTISQHGVFVQPSNHLLCPIEVRLSQHSHPPSPWCHLSSPFFLPSGDLSEPYVIQSPI